MLAAESKVDFQVKKLTGKCMFQLILHSMINCKRASFLFMEAMFHTMQFRLVAGKEGIETKYNSILDRIATINPHYYKKILQFLLKYFNKLISLQDSITKYDSTMVTVSKALVE